MIKLKRIISMLLVVAMVLLYLAPVAIVAAAGETVTTNKVNYDIGETIQVTGSGFTAWTVVPLQIFKDGTTRVYVGQVDADGTGAFATGILAAWSFGNYTLRAGTTASATFALTATGILTTDRLYYLVGATGTLTGAGFPNGPAKALTIVTPGGDVKYILATQPTGASFSDTFLVGAAWAPGSYWGRAVYQLEGITRTVTCAFTVVLVPPVPTGLTATKGHGQVTLAWNAVTNPNQGGYNIYRGIASGVYTPTTPIATTTGTTFTDTTAAAFAGSYYYAVTSFDNTPYPYESVKSTEASATPWGNTASLLIGAISSPQTAGVGFPVSITAKDAFGHTVEDYGVTGTLSDSTGAMTPTSFAFLNGLANPTVVITKAWTGDIISVQAGAITGMSAAFNVTNAAAATLALSPATATNMVGTTHTVTVLARDVYLNPVPALSITFTVTGANPGGGSSATNAQGIAVFTYAGMVVGSDHIRAANPNVPPAPPLLSNVVDKIWLSGPLHHFTFVGAISSPQTAGIGFSVSIEARDSFGNKVVSYNGTANLTGPIGSYTPTTVTFTNGAASPSVTINTTQTTTLTAASGAITGASNSFIVNPGALDHFGWATISSPQIATIPFAVTITAYDAAGNVKTNFTGTATLSASNGGVTPSITTTFIAGVWVGNVAVDNDGHLVGLTAASGAATGTSNAFLVAPHTITVTFNLIAGWNMITLPVTPESTNPNVVFAGLTGWSFYSWDAATGTYQDKDHTVLARGVGYWLKVLSPVEYDVTGLPDRGASTTLSIASGWNMIGNPYTAGIMWDEVLVSKNGGTPISLDDAINPPNNWIKSPLYHWAGAIYQTLSTGGEFVTLYGYWISAKVSGLTLIFPNPYP